MSNEFRIHIENRSIVLVNGFSDHFKDNLGLYYSYSSIEELSKILDFFQSIKIIPNLFLNGKSADIMLGELSRFFQVITAAGGLVQNAGGDYLMIYRRGHWDLPKGKSETNESIENTALREVSEETGISNLILGNHLIDTYHTYHLNGNTVLKKSVWFEMKYVGNESLIPQLQEDITEAKWVKKEEFDRYLSNSYQTIKEVFGAANLV